MGNPPAGHLALVRVQGADAAAVEERAKRIAARLRPRIESVRAAHAPMPGSDPGASEVEAAGPVLMMLGPMPSPIERINRRVRWQLLLRARQRGPLRWLLGELRPALGAEGSGEGLTMAMVDVDPQTML